MRGPISADDHAFADGPVFDRVSSLAEAEAALLAVGLDPERLTCERLLSVWMRFDQGAELGAGVKLGLNARLVNGSEPKRVKIAGPAAVRGVLRAEADGSITIGKFSYIGDDVIISARAGVSIGEATLLGHGVQVFDNDSHPTDPYQREIQFRRMLGDKSVAVPIEIAAAPVHIGSRCWIGLGSLVLKGVSIGNDSIVAACSVVTSDVSASVVAAGNPARAVKSLTNVDANASDD
jgi:acetyltransferase-like isoleucine patch superfamily enzyme